MCIRDKYLSVPFVASVHWLEPRTFSAAVPRVLAKSGVGGATVSPKPAGVTASSLACLMMATPSTRWTEPMMTSGCSPLTLVSAELTSEVPLGKYCGPRTVKPWSWAVFRPPSVTVLEKPSSAERNTTLLGLGVASSAMALTIEEEYSVAGDKTAKVLL